MAESADGAIVSAFNAAIDDRSLSRLAALMTDDHRLVDTEGHAVEGKDACSDDWRGFFLSFPDYRNVFDVLEDGGDGVVEATGRSGCSTEPELEGPAHWRAVVRGGRVAEWRVLEA